MLNIRQRERTSTIEGILPSLLLSLLASAAATFLLRQILSTASRTGGDEQEGGQPRGSGGSVNVNVPVIVVTIVARNRWGFGRRPSPPPFFLPFMLARAIRKKRGARRSVARPPLRRLMR
jgi:hypothetical protein